MKSDPFPNTSARQRIINNSKQELLHDNKNQTIITVIKQNKHRKKKFGMPIYTIKFPLACHLNASYSFTKRKRTYCN